MAKKRAKKTPLPAENSGADRREDGMPVGTPYGEGVSGNPGGRPTGFKEFKQWCRDHSDRAGKALLDNLKDPEGGVRNKAAEIIWAYAWGKPTQAVEVSGPDGAPVKSEVVNVGPDKLRAVLGVLADAGVFAPGSRADAADEGTPAAMERIPRPGG